LHAGQQAEQSGQLHEMEDAIVVESHPEPEHHARRRGVFLASDALLPTFHSEFSVAVIGLHSLMRDYWKKGAIYFAPPEPAGFWRRAISRNSQARA
jgi:hypothetical protein